MQQVKLKIEGMMCTHCQKHVTKSFLKVVGVKEVTVNLEKSTAEISYNEVETNELLIKKALAKTNYSIA